MHLKDLFTRLWRHINLIRRKQLGFLLILIVLSSFAELVSIGAVVPFLGVLSSPERAYSYPITQPFIEWLGLKGPDQLMLILSIAFIFAAIVSGGLRMLLLWASTRLAYSIGADLSSSIYQKTLYQPYAVHTLRNSSEIIDGISSKTHGVINVMMAILNLIASFVIVLPILIALLSVNSSIALITIFGFGSIYLAIILLTKKRLMINGVIYARESARVIKSLQEGLSGIRDVLIDGSQRAYCQIYRQADQPMRQSQASSAFIGGSPRIAMEVLGMVLIVGLALSLVKQPGGLATVIPALGAIALMGQRLLPVLQQAYSAWSSIESGRAGLRDALDLLDQPLPDYVGGRTEPAPIKFENAIQLKQVSFRYSTSTSLVLKKISIEIPKGSRIGFIGRTGSGKSTLIDILMGLLSPTSGAIEIDGQPLNDANHRSWQLHIAHVPQAIFIADKTIEENIAFGVPIDQIDHDRVKNSARMAQIAEIIENWPRGYQTQVGERGVRLSGGQRQRIGIARALYKKANVIVFDEATSALDAETEQEVMQAIEGLGSELTILIIAHRLTTLKKCNEIVELKEGRINRKGSYDEIIADINHAIVRL